MTKQLNTKGLWSFLIITFGLTLLVILLMGLAGLKVIGDDVITGQIIVLGVMFIPALASLVTRKFISKEGWSDAGLNWAKFRDYLKIWLTILLVFLLIYIITAIFGNSPDWNMQIFATSIGEQAPEYPAIAIFTIFLITLFITPFINSIAGFGEELGWRGFLLPKLMYMGTKKALIVQAVIWGFWHVPFVILLGFGNYPNIWLGALYLWVLISLIGIYFGYLRLKSGSIMTVSWAHGMLNAQSYGVWLIIFPSLNRFLYGFSGLIGIVIFGILALYCLQKLDKDKQVKI